MQHRYIHSQWSWLACLFFFLQTLQTDWNEWMREYTKERQIVGPIYTYTFTCIRYSHRVWEWKNTEPMRDPLEFFFFLFAFFRLFYIIIGSRKLSWRKRREEHRILDKYWTRNNTSTKYWRIRLFFRVQIGTIIHTVVSIRIASLAEGWRNLLHIACETIWRYCVTHTIQILIASTWRFAFHSIFSFYFPLVFYSHRSVWGSVWVALLQTLKLLLHHLHIFTFLHHFIEILGTTIFHWFRFNNFTERNTSSTMNVGVCSMRCAQLLVEYCETRVSTGFCVCFVF